MLRASTGLVLLVLLARVAHAHHPVSESGVAPVAPSSRAELELSAGTFTLAGESGHYQLATPSLEVGLGGRFSVGARLPLALVTYEDGHGERGVGDAELSFKVAVWRSAHDELVVSAGAGIELPTGDEASGLGGGHVELTPFVLAATAWSGGGGVTWVATGYLATHFSLLESEPVVAPAGTIFHVVDGGGGVHGAVIAPHAGRELVARASLAALRGRWFGALGLEGVQQLDDVGPGPFIVRGEAGAGLDEHWRLSVGSAATVAGEPRFGLRGHVTLSRRF